MNREEKRSQQFKKNDRRVKSGKLGSPIKQAKKLDRLPVDDSQDR